MECSRAKNGAAIPNGQIQKRWKKLPADSLSRTQKPAVRRLVVLRPACRQTFGPVVHGILTVCWQGGPPLSRLSPQGASRGGNHGSDALPSRKFSHFTCFLPLDRPQTRLNSRWRRGSESNRRIGLLQSPALPLGYPAIRRRTLPRCSAGATKNFKKIVDKAMRERLCALP